jgi:hypothetical protein
MAFQGIQVAEFTAPHHRYVIEGGGKIRRAGVNDLGDAQSGNA